MDIHFLYFVLKYDMIFTAESFFRAQHFISKILKDLINTYL